MKVTAALTLPKSTYVTVTIQATLEQLHSLKRQLDEGQWSPTGELLVRAIRDATGNLQTVAETEIEHE